MQLGQRSKAFRLATSLLFCTAAAVLWPRFLPAQPKPAASPSAPAGPSPAAPDPQADPSEPLYRLGFKFNPAASCANAVCHGAADRQRDKENGWLVRDNSYALWNRDATPDQPADPHRTSWRKLRGDPAKGIGRKMAIANPAADARCLSCHALNPPETLLDGPNKLYSDGVTCDACPGPSGESVTLPATDLARAGRLVLHEQRGWVKAQRAKFDKQPKELLKKFGFYDNHSLLARARRCTSCHLAIDAKVLAAGHPQPAFELSWFTRTYDSRHWEDPTENYFGARLWAAGQIVALRDALRQLADRAAAPAAPAVTDADVNGAYNQAAGHYAVVRALFSGGVNGNLGGVAGPLASARGLLAEGARRAELAAAARAAAEAADKLAPAVEAFAPDRASTRNVLDAVLAQGDTAETSGGPGIEQQRDAVFALYEAYAAGGGVEQAKAEADRKFIGEKLFPTDAEGRFVPAKDLDKARYKAAVAEVRARLGG